MSRSVDYFEVGKQQLGELVDYDMSFSYGDYVVVSMGAVFGRVSDELNLVERYSSEYWAFRHAENMQRMSFTFSACYGCVLDYEVWHVVDDAELWQVWEHDVAVSKRQRNTPTGWSVYHGGVLVLYTESVPTCLYRLRCIRANCEGVCDGWYIDEHGFADALGAWVSRGWMPWHSFVRELGDCVTILDDDCLELDDYGDGTVLTVVCQESC